VGPLVGPEVGRELGPEVGHDQQFGIDVFLSTAKVLCRRPFRLVIIAEANNNLSEYYYRTNKITKRTQYMSHYNNLLHPDHVQRQICTLKT
jgi:hypothetical protein